MAAASYDQLLKQVEALKMENSNLRQELEDNSNHLTKLETEASNMKVSRLWLLIAVYPFLFSIPSYKLGVRQFTHLKVLFLS